MEPTKLELLALWEMDPAVRAWRRQFMRDFGYVPQMNGGDYDYRLALQSGMRPELYTHDNRYHWPSATPDGRSLKSPDHPTAWMETFMERFGIDPHDAVRGSAGSEARTAAEKGFSSMLRRHRLQDLVGGEP